MHPYCIKYFSSLSIFVEFGQAQIIVYLKRNWFLTTNQTVRGFHSFPLFYARLILHLNLNLHVFLNLQEKKANTLVTPQIKLLLFFHISRKIEDLF